MANPALGSVVKFLRASDDVEFNALVLSDEGPGFIGVAYVDTVASPAFVATAIPVPLAVPNGNGLVIV
jgi:hypothetical protein